MNGTNGTPDAIDTLIDGIIEHEGRTFTDHPADRGGPTKFGITLKTLHAFRGNNALTADAVRDLTEDEARQIYRQDYVDGPGFGGIADEKLRFEVVDAGVLHGPGWAARRLQEVAHVNVDGDVGSITLGAVNAADAEKLRLAFIARRVRRVGRIVAGNPSQLVFLNGWLNRATESLMED